MNKKDIEIIMQELPEDLKKEVLDYIEFLLTKHKNKKIEIRKLKFDWEGSLSDIKDKFTSIELQHKALEWR